MCVHEIKITRADYVLQQLDDHAPEEYDWSQGYSPSLKTALEEHSKQYYVNNNHAMLHTDKGPPFLTRKSIG